MVRVVINLEKVVDGKAPKIYEYESQTTFIKKKEKYRPKRTESADSIIEKLTK
jgi:hypothetical protein